jgi:hypothetical protein
MLSCLVVGFVKLFFKFQKYFKMSDFFSELLLRLFGKTPWFFKVVQVLAVVTALVTGLPEFLESAGVDLPAAWDAVSSKVVSIASLVAAFIAQLPVTTDVKKKENLPD